MKQSLQILFFCATVACNPPAPDSTNHAPNCNQLVVVISPSDTSTQAHLRRFEKNGEQWKPVGEQVEVMLGRTGLAWGKGEHSPQPGQQKQEGDGKSPSGIYSFGEIFGYAPPSEVRFKMPYVHANEALECVDDSGSKFYNQLVDNTLVEKDWASSELMRRPDDQYKWGIVVNHNTPSVAQGGSCIFLHIWKAAGSATSGCTAMTEANLLSLLHWLDPAKSPKLLQVTAADYPSFQKQFGLPD